MYFQMYLIRIFDLENKGQDVVNLDETWHTNLLCQHEKIGASICMFRGGRTACHRNAVQLRWKRVMAELAQFH